MVDFLNILVDNRVLEVAEQRELQDACAICFYLDKEGNCPAKQYFETLRGNKEDKRIVSKFRAFLKEWIRKGHTPKYPEHFRSIPPLYELKAYRGRLLIFFDERICVVANGFNKPKKKEQTSEIERGKRIYQEYTRRKESLRKENKDVVG
jgi:hypothetical protein